MHNREDDCARRSQQANPNPHADRSLITMIRQSANRRVILLWLRRSLWFGIWYSVVSLVWSLTSLLRSDTSLTISKPRTSVELFHSDQFEEFLLNGFWGIAKTPFGFKISTVSSSELENSFDRTLESRNARLSDIDGPASGFETALLTFVQKLGPTKHTEGADQIISGERSGMKYQLCTTGPSFLRIRYARICWQISQDSWGFAEMVLQPGLGRDRFSEIHASIPGLEEPIARRFSDTGEVTGAVYLYSLPFRELRSHCAAVGRDMVIDSENEHLFTGRIKPEETLFLYSKATDSDIDYLILLKSTTK